LIDLVDVNSREGLGAESLSFGRLALRRLLRHRLAIVSLVLLVLMVIAFFFAGRLSNFSFDAVDVTKRLQNPSREHPFGTDEIGRDLFVRTMLGGQYSVRVALQVAVIATALGTLLGALAGYFGKWIDVAISQAINLILIVPALIVLAVFAQRFGGSPAGLALVLSGLLWTRIARVVRGVVMQYKEQEFVLAAKAVGAKPWRIVTRHILPNVVGSVLVEITLLLGTAIVLESTLSFLGLGVQPPVPTLGNLIQQSKGAIDDAPLRVLLPGFFVVFFVLFINFLGDGLRDALDPRSKRQ
jgi:ABC-type dipeptide/oligopeptide/nickel transport system permease subunit